MWPEVLQMWPWQVAILLSICGLPEASWASLCQQESPSSRDPAFQHLQENPVERSFISDCALVLRKTQTKVTSRTTMETHPDTCNLPLFASFLCAKARTKSFGSYLKLAVYSELIGLSHLVIWDSECVNLALGIFSSPQATDRHSHEDTPSPSFGISWDFFMSLLAQGEVYSKGQSLTNQNQIDCPLPSQVTSTTQYFIDFVFLFFFCCNTRLPPFHHIWLIYLFAFGPAQRLLTAWWRHSGRKRLIASTARAAWLGCSRTGEEQRGQGGASVQMGFYFYPPPQEEERAGVYWWCDPAVERRIDGWSWSPQLSTWLG